MIRISIVLFARIVCSISNSKTKWLKVGALVTLCLFVMYEKCKDEYIKKQVGK